jgi:cobalamin biosynthesis Mg chelatase CobN
MSSEGSETTEERGRHEKELNEQAAERDAEESRAEDEAEAIEQPSVPEEPTDPDQLRGEIAEARDELGETVEALAAKTDVKAQAKEKVEEQKAQLKDKQAQAQAKLQENPQVAVAAGMAVLLMVVLFVRRRSR